MTAKLNSEIKSTDTPWLVLSKAIPQAQLRLFCFPYAGGNAQVYRTWANSLPRTVEVCAVEIPGRGRRLREPAHHQLSSLVEDLYPLPRKNTPSKFAILLSKI